MLLLFNLLDYQMWEEQAGVWGKAMHSLPSRTGGRGGLFWPLLTGKVLAQVK